MEGNKKQIIDFRDLDVYRSLYALSKVVLTKVIIKLPQEEKYDLIDQLRRACKAAPALLAEGFAKRYQIKHWQKYIIDTIGECNEMMHHLTIVKDIYYKNINSDSCQVLINRYEICCKQLTNLGKSWSKYHKQ